MKTLEPGLGAVVNKCFCGCSAVLLCGLWGPGPPTLRSSSALMKPVCSWWERRCGALALWLRWTRVLTWVAHYVEGHGETLHSPWAGFTSFTLCVVLIHVTTRPNSTPRMGRCWVPYGGFMSQCLGWQGRIGSALRHIVGLACASELPDPLSRHPMASSDGPLRVRLEYSEPTH